MNADMSKVVKKVVARYHLSTDEQGLFTELRLYHFAAAAKFAAYAMAQEQASKNPALGLEDPVKKAEMEEAETAYQNKLKQMPQIVVNAMAMFLKEFV